MRGQTKTKTKTEACVGGCGKWLAVQGCSVPWGGDRRVGSCVGCLLSAVAGWVGSLGVPAVPWSAPVGAAGGPMLTVGWCVRGLVAAVCRWMGVPPGCALAVSWAALVGVAGRLVLPVGGSGRGGAGWAGWPGWCRGACGGASARAWVPPAGPRARAL